MVARNVAIVASHASVGVDWPVSKVSPVAVETRSVLIVLIQARAGRGDVRPVA